MTTFRFEQENNLRNYAHNGNLEGIRAILDNPCTDFNINSTDSSGRSALFIALSQGIAVHNREIIDILLANGAVIKNGAIITPSKIPKLLTRHANAKSLELIFQRLTFQLGNTLNSGLILEIGSGDGYLKYLLSLGDHPLLEDLKDRLVETEISSEIVAHNFVNGKSVINTGITGLLTVFGCSCFSGVISMNVLDTFTPDELAANLRIISNLLKPGGVVIHIMSSAIHENIFSELEARINASRFPDQVLLPYCREGHIGLRVIAKDNPWLMQNQLPQVPARHWFELFAQNPGEYVELADKITADYTISGMPIQNTILFKDYFCDKIKTAFEKTGYQLFGHDEATSGVVMMKDEYHGRIPDTNYFHNILGVLMTDYYPPENINPGQVMEKSTFLWVMARWGG